MLGDELKEHRGMLGCAGPLYPADIVDKTVAKLQHELMRYKIKYCIAKAAICHNLSSEYSMEMVSATDDIDMEDALESINNAEKAREHWKQESDKYYNRNIKWLKCAGKLKNEMR